MGRRSDYSAGLYKQFEEVMSRLSLLESEHAKDGERLRQLNHNILVQAGDIRKLSDENQHLKDTHTSHTEIGSKSLKPYCF